MYRILPSFDYLEPRTIEEASQVLSTYGAKAKVLAGGTDLLVSMKRRRDTPGTVVCIRNIPGLDYIEPLQDGGARIGALTTHNSIAASPLVNRSFKALAAASGKVGTPHIRRMGTIGGNICMAGPSQDTPPALLVLDAQLKLVSSGNERLVPISKFFVSPFKTAIKETELLTEIRIAPLPRRTAGLYLYATKRTAVDETLAGVALLITLGNDNVCKDVRIGLCSLSPTPMRARRTEQILTGEKLTAKKIEEAAVAIMAEVSPRSRPEQRRRMAGILLKKAINEVRREIEQEQA